MTFGASKPCAPCGSRNWPRLGSFQTVKLFTRRQRRIRTRRDVAARVAGRDGTAERAVVARVERRDARRPAAVGPGGRLHDREQDARALRLAAPRTISSVARPLVGGIARLGGLLPGARARRSTSRRCSGSMSGRSSCISCQARGSAELRYASSCRPELEPGGRRRGDDAEREHQCDEQPAHPGTVARMRRQSAHGLTS